MKLDKEQAEANPFREVGVRLPVLVQRKGFTMVELVIVIAILGILAATALPRFGDFSSTARVNTMNAQARSFLAAVNAIYGAWQIAGSPTSGSIVYGTQTLTVANSTGNLTTLGYPRVDASNAGTNNSALWGRVMQGSGTIMPSGWVTRSGANTTDAAAGATAYPATPTTFAVSGQQVFYLSARSACGFVYSHGDGSIILSTTCN